MPTIGSMLGDAEATAGETFKINLGNAVNQDGTITIALKTTVNPAYKIHSSESTKTIKRPQLLVFSNILVAPTANDDSYTLTQATSLNQTPSGVLKNDTQPGAENMTATRVQDVTHGSLTLNANGTFTYTPDTDFWGWDSFIYKASNSYGESEEATVELAVQRTLTDTDADGIDDTWETTHAGNLTTMNSSTDTDNDGKKDADEYLAQTNPIDAADFFEIIHITPETTDQWRLEWRSKAGMRYRIMMSNSLHTDSWSMVKESIPSSSAITSSVIASSKTRTLYRVETMEP